MRSARWLLGLGIAATVATASAATEERSSLATCGHLEELAAAKRALEQGDQASALNRCTSRKDAIEIGGSQGQDGKLVRRTPANEPLPELGHHG